jgi:hypothetical protein
MKDQQPLRSSDFYLISQTVSLYALALLHQNMPNLFKYIVVFTQQTYAQHPL